MVNLVRLETKAEVLPAVLTPDNFRMPEQAVQQDR